MLVISEKRRFSDMERQRINPQPYALAIHVIGQDQGVRKPKLGSARHQPSSHGAKIAPSSSPITDLQCRVNRADKKGVGRAGNRNPNEISLRMFFRRTDPRGWWDSASLGNSVVGLTRTHGAHPPVMLVDAFEIVQMSRIDPVPGRVGGCSAI
ncbi:hypothetical protein N7492_001419 [Penicillium capsulatum]|uniref:Uncharacterized protein n=1 Tax=Penicillium capsulatum TaxID=69766 RepID=A0A9W9LZP7_9EURO|nr:hypothetical protein N7492_001419 [Penicillium capsulatum]KAJ6129525.1 hypothetical protein N7512_002305 [Penicillium capsulatum]